MFNEFRYGAGTGGGARKQGWAATQSSRVPSRSGDDRIIEERQSASILALGGNGATLAVVSSFRASQPGGLITVHLIPLATTPLGTAIGTARQEVGVPLQGLIEWIDRTFSAEDEHAFVASMHDLDLLARIGWDAPLPESIDAPAVINLEDLPDDVAEGLRQQPALLVQCASCRRLCVADEFVFKAKQLCAWDYHAQVFGKRGPWHDGPYESRHFTTLPSCAYVVTPLLMELGVETVLTVNGLPDNVAEGIVNAAVSGDPGRAHMAVRTTDGLTLLREG